MVAALANPYHGDVYVILRSASDTLTLRALSDWLPPGTDRLVGKTFVASLLLTVVAIALPGRRPTAREFALLLFFLPPAFSAARMVPFWLLATLPVTAAQLGSWLLADRPARRLSPAVGRVALGLLLLAAVGSLPWIDRTTASEPKDLAQVADHLRGRDGGTRRVFSRPDWGEYLAWSLTPDGYRVFLGGQSAVAPVPIWADYLALTNGCAGWQDVLDRHQVDCLVLDLGPGDHRTHLLPLVEKSPQWRRAFQSGAAAVFVRVPSSNPSASGGP
jgi:hypothetical protein